MHAGGGRETGNLFGVALRAWVTILAVRLILSKVVCRLLA